MELRSQVLVNNDMETFMKYDLFISSVPHNQFKDKEYTQYLELLISNGFIIDKKINDKVRE